MSTQCNHPAQNDGFQNNIEPCKHHKSVLHEVVAALPGFIYRCSNDQNRTMQFISEKCEEITGYSPNELTNNHTIAYSSLIHPDYQEKIWRKWQQINPSNHIVQDVYPILHKNGDIRWVYEFGSGVYSKKKLFLYVEGFISDITSEKTVEDTYRVTKNTAYEIIEAIPSGFFIYQFKKPNKLFLIYANPEARVLSRDDIQDYIGKEFDAIWPEAYKTALKHNFLESIATRKVFSIDEFHYTDTYTNGVYRIRAFLLPGERLAIAFENITKLHLAEKKLDESEKMLDSILQYSPIHIFIKDDQNHLLKFSNSMKVCEDSIAAEVTHTQSKESSLPIYNANQVLMEAIIHSDNSIFSKQGSVESVVELDGKFYRTIQFPITISHDKDYIVGFSIDITESKEMEISLKNRITALNRFNQLTVNRELKMIDLKREVNQLLTALGKKEKYKIIK